MTRSGKKKICPGCNIVINGGNQNLLAHMKKSSLCSKHILICIGCSKHFADENHLRNHQRSQQASNPHTSCIHGFAKLEHVQTLSLDSNPFDTKLNNQVFAVEQQAFPDNPNISILTSNKKIKLSSDISVEMNSSSDHQSLLTQEDEEITSTFLKQSSTNRKKNINPRFEHHSNNISKDLMEKNNSRKPDKNTSVHTLGSFQQKHNKTKSTFFGTTHNNTSGCYAIDSLDSTKYDNIFPEKETTEYPTIDINNQDSSIYQELLNNLEEEEEDDDDDMPDNNDRSNHSLSDTFSCEDVVEEEVVDNDDEEQQNLLLTQEEQEDENELEVVQNKPNSTYIKDRIEFISAHRKNTSFSCIDIALIELYNSHKKSGAPICLFDRTLTWVQRHGASFFTTSTGAKVLPKQKIPSRSSFIKKMYEKVHSKKFHDKVLPRELTIPITPTTHTKVTAFDIREVLADMLSNNNIMSNLLFFDDNNPMSVHPGSSTVGEIVTSDVFLNAAKRLCVKENDVLFPLIMYSDEVNLDTYSKLKLDPLSFTFGRLPVHIRNQPFAWRYLGFLSTLKSYEYSKDVDAKFKMEIYHRCLSAMLSSLTDIQKEGGIPFNLKLKNGSFCKVNLKLYVQFVIGDTKGHDYLCGRKGSYSLGMAQLLRDCDVSPQNADELNHICKYRTIMEVQELKKVDQCHIISFNNIKNAFDEIDMGDVDHGIFGATCGEPLHIMEMKLLELVSGVFSNSLCSSSNEILRRTIIHIVSAVESTWTKENFYALSAFREGLTQVKQLTGKERHARLFAIYLSLMCSDCSKTIINNPKKNDSKDRSYGKKNLQKWLELIEDSLILMKWIRKSNHNREDLYNPLYLNSHDKHSNNPIQIEKDNLMSIGSKAQNAVLRYLKAYKKLVVRNEGNGLKIPKFHLMLHVVRNICRHGAVGNYDGSRPEAIAKDLAKSPGLRTQKNHKSISFQSASRYHEDITVAEAERIFHESFEYESSYTYFGPKKEQNNKKKLTLGGSHFTLSLEFKKHNLRNSMNSNSPHKYKETIEAIVSRVTWNGKNVQKRINDHILYCLTNWLWIDKLGGTISKDSCPTFFTEMNLNGEVIRCHPDYRKEKSINDWVYVDWGEGYPDPLPARLHLLIDISDCTVISEVPFTNISRNKKRIMDLLPKAYESHFEASTYLLTHSKWAVIHSAVDDGYMDEKDYSKYQLFSKIAKRIHMENNKYRIIPISDIVGRAFGLSNSVPLENTNVYDNTAIILNPSSSWSELFLQHGE